jgi:hypothetical protein
VTARRWRACLWLLGSACLLLPVFPPPPLQSGAYVQDVTTTTAVVAMITAAPATRSLRVVDAAGAVQQVAAAGAPARRHAFAVTGLRPDTAHEFEVLDGSGSAVDRGSFHTAPADDATPVHFAVIGDSGGLPWWIWLQRSPLIHLPACRGWLPPAATVAAAGRRIAAARPRFVLHVGDVVYPWGQQQHYGPGFFLPFAEALRHAPFYVALGNHDVLDDEGRQALATFHLPRGELTGDERCYTFACGSVRVFVVDFNWGIAEDRVAAGHPSLEFLRRELPRHGEPWFVVASHYPMRSASRQRDRGDLLLEVLPLLQQHGVDLYLSGHDHTYQRVAPEDGVVMVVSGGGGKSLYELHQHERVRVAQSQYHWCSVEAQAGRLTLRALAFDGALLDTVELAQPAQGERFERIRAANPQRASRIAAWR